MRCMGHNSVHTSRRHCSKVPYSIDTVSDTPYDTAARCVYIHSCVVVHTVHIARDARVRLTEVDAVLCKTVQNRAKWGKMVQNGAKWCKIARKQHANGHGAEMDKHDALIQPPAAPPEEKKSFGGTV